jgi:5-dehydro-2-deoxygluconokinase
MAGTEGQGLGKARSLIDEGAQIVIYKMGELGAITITPEGETRTGIYETQALKPTGAGDSFMAGFLASLADGQSVEEAVRQGSAAAALVVSRVGCAPAMPTPQDVTDFMAHADMRPA